MQGLHFFVSAGSQGVIALTLRQGRKFSFLNGGGCKGLQFSESGEVLLFDVFAGRPDVNKALKCAKRTNISDFITIFIQQMLIEKDKSIPYG